MDFAHGDGCWGEFWGEFFVRRGGGDYAEDAEGEVGIGREDMQEAGTPAT